MPGPMSYDPRTIAYQAEFLHAPREITTNSVQEVHSTLFGTPELSYQNFQVAPNGVHISNPVSSPGAVSSVTFAGDRIVFREELGGITVEDFATRVVNVTRIAYEKLGIPASLAQQIMIRSLITPESCDGARFMMERLMRATSQDWEVFGRPVHSAGLRLTFTDPGNGQQQLFNVRVEPWLQDTRSLWLENAGSFAQPTTTDNLPILGEHVFSTYRFLTGPLSSFLSGFDHP